MIHIKQKRDVECLAFRMGHRPFKTAKTKTINENEMGTIAEIKTQLGTVNAREIAWKTCDPVFGLN